jgi:phage FluMu protein Com
VNDATPRCDLCNVQLLKSCDMAEGHCPECRAINEEIDAARALLAECPFSEEDRMALAEGKLPRERLRELVVLWLSSGASP